MHFEKHHFLFILLVKEEDFKQFNPSLVDLYVKRKPDVINMVNISGAIL